MAGETVLTLVGNACGDPDLRYTTSGVPVCSFTLASTPRKLNKATDVWEDGDALFLRVTAWRDLAEHIAASVAKGTRVVVVGRLSQRSYESAEGEKRTVYEVEADEVACSLRYATAAVQKATRTASAPTAADAWSTADPALGAALT